MEYSLEQILEMLKTKTEQSTSGTYVSVYRFIPNKFFISDQISTKLYGMVNEKFFIYDYETERAGLVLKLKERFYIFWERDINLQPLRFQQIDALKRAKSCEEDKRKIELIQMAISELAEKYKLKTLIN